MNIDVFTRTEWPMVARVLRTALRPVGTLDTNERAFLDTYARICGFPVFHEDPDPIDRVDLADVAIVGPGRRKRLVQLAGMAVMLARPIRPASIDFLQALALQLDAQDTIVDVARAVRMGKYLRARLIAMRRGLKGILAEAYGAEGVMGVLRFLSAVFLGARVNGTRLLEFKRLGLLPEGTVGREYWKHMTSNGFGFPGEPAGIAETVVYHHVAHVLAGHDTTPLGEMQQGSFQGGNRRRDGFFFIQFVLLQFHHGIQVTPGAPPQVGNFCPEKVLWAIHRGAKCRIDMTSQWDFWPLMTLSLQEARERCGLMPRPESLQGTLS